MGLIKIGEIRIACVVLDTKQRVLTREGIMSAMGLAKKGSSNGSESVTQLPDFLTADNLKPFINNDLPSVTQLIRFHPPRGGYKGVAYGYPAESLPAACGIYLAARRSNALKSYQQHIAQTCELIMCGLATVGIIALVDEATGYQQDRREDELRKILEAYISPELLPWTKRFPDEYYRQICRLSGTSHDPRKRPGWIGHFTNRIVYEQLPAGVLQELQQRNLDRKVRHHQLLTSDIGCPHLERQLTKMVTAMQLSSDWFDFWRKFRKLPSAIPHQGSLEMVLPEDITSEEDISSGNLVSLESARANRTEKKKIHRPQEHPASNE